MHLFHLRTKLICPQMRCTSHAAGPAARIFERLPGPPPCFNGLPWPRRLRKVLPARDFEPWRTFAALPILRLCSRPVWPAQPCRPRRGPARRPARIASALRPFAPHNPAPRPISDAVVPSWARISRLPRIWPVPDRSGSSHQRLAPAFQRIGEVRAFLVGEGEFGDGPVGIAAIQQSLTPIGIGKRDGLLSVIARANQQSARACWPSSSAMRARAMRQS